MKDLFLRPRISYPTATGYLFAGGFATFTDTVAHESVCGRDSEICTMYCIMQSLPRLCFFVK